MAIFFSFSFIGIVSRCSILWKKCNAISVQFERRIVYFSYFVTLAAFLIIALPKIISIHGYAKVLDIILLINLGGVDDENMKFNILK